MKQNKFDIFKGTTQVERYRNELSPDFLKIDERTLPDMLEFVRKYSGLIKFYDQKALLGADQSAHWKDFFNRDNLILLIGIANFNISKLERYIQALLDKAYLASSQKVKKRIANLLIENILSIADSLNFVRKTVTENEQTADFLFAIRNAIEQELEQSIKTLYAYKSLLSWEEPIEGLFQELIQDWGIKNHHHYYSPTSLTNAEIDEIKQTFNVFFYTINHTIERANTLVGVLMGGVKNNTPHIALYIAFLKLFQHAQNLLNQLPQKHLDFYYREVLQQKPKKAIADEVFVALQLSKDVGSHTLEKGSLLSTDKKEGIDELHYQVHKTTYLTAVNIQKVCSLFKSTDDRYHQKANEYFVTSFYAKEKKREGKLLQLEDWALFGEEQVLKSTTEKTMTEGRLGFILESPFFNLSYGKRSISIIFDFAPIAFQKTIALLEMVSKNNSQPVEDTIYKVFSTAFDIVISQKTEIKTIEKYGFELNQDQCQWVFTIELSSHEAAMEALEDTTILYKSPLPQNPFVQITLKHECSLFLYSLVAGLTIQNIQLEAHVSDLKNLVLYNNLGKLNPNKPFELFGTIPQNKHYFIVGHPEAFSKNITQLDITLDWFSLPLEEQSMEEYYETYLNEQLDHAVTEDIHASHYRILPSLLQQSKWKSFPTMPSISLFEPLQIDGTQIANRYQGSLAFSLGLSELAHEASTTPTAVLDQHTTEGFLRFDLDCPNFAFGHKDYANILSETVLKNGQVKKKQPTLENPPQPFTPKVEKISMSYRAYLSAFGSGKQASQAVRFYHLHPFGYEEVPLKSPDQKLPLMPTETEEASLLLGFNDYPYAGRISLLFEMNHEETNALSALGTKVSWWYLKNNQWVKMDSTSIISDSTYGFVNSGIIELKIPKQINRKNTIVDNAYYWIKATVSQHATHFAKVKAIYENGVHAIWQVEEDAQRDSHSLAAYSITHMAGEQKAIERTIQPIKSFKGRAKESEKHFYVRLSERLSHKKRAINRLDYEQLVLEQFPQVFKVKCFTAEATLADNYKSIPNLVLPGTVRVVVIPDITHLDDAFCPQFNVAVLSEITEYLQKHVSPFVDVIVSNPFYEQIRIICKVSFVGEESDSFYIRQLRVHIIEFLNPWLVEADDDEEFGVSKYRSEVLAFIQTLDYVQYVTEFSMLKIVAKNDKYSMYDSAKEKENAEEISPIYPWSIMVSARDHEITLIDDQSYEAPKARTINNMELGTDFIISK